MKVRVYRIHNWTDRFENNRTRDMKRMTWVPIPNHHDSASFCELMLHQNGAAHYGIWCLLAQVASKCRPRGTLLRDGCAPYGTEVLACMIRVPPKQIAEAIPRLLKIGWLEETFVEVPDSQDGAGDCGKTAGGCGKTAGGCSEGKGMEGNGREGKDIGETGVSPSVKKEESDEEWLSRLSGDPAYSGLDVSAQYSRMRHWCEANHKPPTRRRFVNWLNRCDKPMQGGQTLCDLFRSEKAAKEFPEPPVNLPKL